MEEPRPVKPTLVRFGVFEVDLRAGELRRSGSKVKLQEQPFQVLAMLLERPGEVVTREAIQQKLWPSDTFVDFEHSINAAVKRLREALDDDADNPRFVETLPRRGYRFIAQVAAASPPPEAVEAISYRHPRRGDVKSPLQGRLAVAIMAIFATLLALNVGGLREWVMRAVAAVSDRRAAVGTPPLQKIESIAVLPLENLSGDKEQEYFADGMTDELITNLGKISALRVISRTSAMHYKGTKKRLPEIAKELNVAAIVEGTVQRSGDRVRITANLLHAPTDRHLWAESYERDLRDILAMQSDLARAIAREVQAKLTPQEQTRLASVGLVDPEAYQAYVMGRYFWSKRTEDGLKKAITYFEQALKRDPGYAVAWAGLADCYNLLANFDFLPPKEGFPKAKEAATKALELDETLAEGHTSLGYVKTNYDWDWPGAERELKRALALNPNYATAHHWYSDHLMVVGRHEEAIAEIKRAQQLDPLSLIINAVAGFQFQRARRYDQAVEQLRKTLEMDPIFPVAHLWLAQTYEQTGHYGSAIAEHQKARTALGGGSYAVAALGYAYAAAGKRNEARRILTELNERDKTAYVSPYAIGVVHLGLKQEDKALEWLERAYEDRDVRMVELKSDPRLDPLRSNPRFQDLLRRMNFPP
jgi:TolB-like protein/DNA-binding winged helix-turn-helix (wHTH) protein/Tfp pilus assembly protein PilF